MKIIFTIEVDNYLDAATTQEALDGACVTYTSKQIDGPVKKRRQKKNAVTPAVVKAAKKGLRAGLSHAKIAKQVGVSAASVWRISQGQYDA